MTAMGDAIAAASSNMTGTGSAYIRLSGTSEITVTFHFSNYTHANGVKINGTITAPQSGAQNGTLNLTGTSVISQVVFIDVTPTTGTQTFAFVDGTTWTYDIAANTLTAK